MKYSPRKRTSRWYKVPEGGEGVLLERSVEEDGSWEGGKKFVSSLLSSVPAENLSTQAWHEFFLAAAKARCGKWLEYFWYFFNTYTWFRESSDGTVFYLNPLDIFISIQEKRTIDM